METFKMLVRAIVASTVWATCTAIIVSVVYYLFPLSADDKPADVLRFILFVGGAAATISIVVTPVLFMLIGVPLYLLSKRIGWTSAYHYATGAFLVTIVLCALLWYGNVRPQTLQPKDVELAIINMLIAGPTAAIVFWKVAKPRSHDASSLPNDAGGTR